ncbi:hypothetical protein FB545_4668 [Peribacillus frigoritolerans]|nr:hypothetical protein FB545_4668 [Peribacillus frigoritolerans]
MAKACLGETPQAQAEEAPRPPAESECLERKSTSRFSLSLSKVWHLPICQMFFHAEMAVKVMVEFPKKVFKYVCIMGLTDHSNNFVVNAR